MTDELFVEDQSVTEWEEISRLEALQRIENMMTEDIAAFEIDFDPIPTGVGTLRLFEWRIVNDNSTGEDQPVLLVMKDPYDSEKPSRWFLHRRLVSED